MKKTIIIILILSTIGVSQVKNIASRSHELGMKQYKLSTAEWFMANNFDCFAEINWTEIDSIMANRTNDFHKLIENTLK